MRPAFLSARLMCTASVTGVMPYSDTTITSRPLAAAKSMKVSAVVLGESLDFALQLKPLADRLYLLENPHLKEGLNVAAGKVKVIAPAGFMEEAVSENVMAGNAMSRRAGVLDALEPEPVASLHPQDLAGQELGAAGNPGDNRQIRGHHPVQQRAEPRHPAPPREQLAQDAVEHADHRQV